MATKLRVTIGGREALATVEGRRVTIEGVTGEWLIEPRADGRWSVNGVPGSALRTPDGTWVTMAGVAARAEVEAAEARPRIRTTDADALRPPMSATVIRITITEGATVSEGDALIVLEAMKMELPIRAPRDGVVKAIHCREGELVQPSTVLIDLE